MKLMTDDYGFKKVDGQSDVYICIADADTRAVMGAKTSRAPHLQRRWEELMASNDGEIWPWGQPPEMVEKFLDKNLKQYMHSSIAEMAEVFVHGRGMGWPDAWLIEDSPLFVGQEVSTRAVDVVGEDRHPSKYAFILNKDTALTDVHYKWIDLLEELQETAEGKGYKFDQIRWALPGTTRTGVTMCNKVRDGVRQLEMIAGLGKPFAQLSESMMAGFEAYAPRATDAVKRGVRPPKSTWEPKIEQLRKGDPKISGNSWVVDVRSCAPVTARVPDEDVARSGPKTYMDEAWNFFGLFEFEVCCSVAAARDWHRHRSVMPWELTVLHDGTGQLFQHPWYDMEALPKTLWEETSSAFWEIVSSDWPNWMALHALPFGAMVKLRCQGRLPALVYMLELRYGSKGANFEYKKQALHGLLKLAATLPEDIVEREHILGCLSEEDMEIWNRCKEYL